MAERVVIDKALIYDLQSAAELNDLDTIKALLRVASAVASNDAYSETRAANFNEHSAKNLHDLRNEATLLRFLAEQVVDSKDDVPEHIMSTAQMAMRRRSAYASNIQSIGDRMRAEGLTKEWSAIVGCIRYTLINQENHDDYTANMAELCMIGATQIDGKTIRSQKDLKKLIELKKENA